MERDYSGYLSDRGGRPKLQALTRTEVEILRYLSHGLRVRDVARAKGVTYETVKSQLRLIYRKLAAKNMPHAIAIAIRHELIQ